MALPKAKEDALSARLASLPAIAGKGWLATARGEALALPTDRVRIPTEKELFLFGKTAGKGAAGEVARQDFSGSYGYVME